MIDPREMKSPERQAYEGYVAMCRRIDVAPMDFDRWQKGAGRTNPKQPVLGLRLKGKLAVISS